MNQKNKKSGFTIIEVLIVVSIIGMLATIMLVTYTNSLKRSRDNRRVADVESIRLAVNMYADKNGKYPDYSTPGVWSSNANWNNLASNLVDYMNISNTKDPKDPTYYYQYISTGSGTDCRFWYYSEVGGVYLNKGCKD